VEIIFQGFTEETYNFIWPTPPLNDPYKGLDLLKHIYQLFHMIAEVVHNEPSFGTRQNGDHHTLVC
jgi:hypothetical protein